MKKMNPVVHFELPAEDRNRMSDFYSKAFGWQMKMYGEEMGNYVVATTTETGENGMIKTPGNINGGFFMKTADGPKHPSVIIAVDDINDGIKEVNSAGGKVMGEPVMIPHVGMYVSFTDTEGNVLSMLQPERM